MANIKDDTLDELLSLPDLSEEERERAVALQAKLQDTAARVSIILNALNQAGAVLVEVTAAMDEPRTLQYDVVLGPSDRFGYLPMRRTDA